MDPDNPKDIKNTNEPNTNNPPNPNPEELLAFGREAPLTRREIVKDLAPIQGDENEGIYLGTNQQASDRLHHPIEDIISGNDQQQQQEEEQQQDGNYFNFFKTKLLQLEEGQETVQQTANPSSSDKKDNNNSNINNKDKGLGKTDGVTQQQPINPSYNTGDIEIISNNDKGLKSSEISPKNIKQPNNDSNINNAKNDLLFMVPNAMNSQLQSCFSSSPESRDAFNFTPAKLSKFQQQNNNSNTPDHPNVTEFNTNKKGNNINTNGSDSNNNNNNLAKQTGNNIPTKKSLLFHQKAQSQSPQHLQSNSTWMLDQIKQGGLWGVKGSKIIIISCIISAIIGIAGFYASDPHGKQAILVVVMYPIYGVLFQILLIFLQRAHYLSNQLKAQQQKDTNAFTKMLIAVSSINQETNKYLKFKVFLTIYKPVLIWTCILAIIISMLYGVIVEIGIVNRLNDGAVELRELIVIQTVLRLFLTVFLVLMNSLVISVNKYSVQNQAKNDHTQIQSNNYLGSVYKEFEAEMNRLQNNLHIGLSNAINSPPTQGNNNMYNTKEQDTDIKNNEENWLQSNDTEHNHGQIVHTIVVNSAKKLMTEDNIIEQQDIKNVIIPEKDKTPRKDKSFSKGLTMTEESHKKRQEILLNTPFKDKSVTWNDQNFPPQASRDMSQKNNQNDQEGKKDIVTHKQKQSKKSISSRIHLFFTPEKQTKDGKRSNVAETAYNNNNINNNNNTNVKDNNDQNGNILISQVNGNTLPTEFAKSETTTIPANGALLKNIRSQSGISNSSMLMRSQRLDEVAFQNQSKVNISSYEITEFWSKINSSEIMRLTTNSFKLILSVIFSHFIGLSIIANYTLHDHEIGFYFASLGLYVCSVIIVKLNAPEERITMKNNPSRSINSINQQQQQQQLLRQQQQYNGMELLLELSNLPFRASIIIACVGCNAIQYSLGQSTRAAWILMGIRILLIICVFIIPAEFIQFRLKKAHEKYLQRVQEAALASHKLTEEDHNNNLDHSRTMKNKILLKIQTKSSPSPANSPQRNHKPSDTSSPQKMPFTKEGSQQLISDNNNNNIIQPISMETPFGMNNFSNTAVIPNQNIGNIPQTSLRTIAMFRTQRAQDLIAQHDKSQMDSKIHNVAVTREQNIHNLIIFCIAQGAAFVAFIVVTFIAKHDGLYHFRSLIGGKVSQDMEVILPGQFDGNYSNVYLVLLIEMLSMLAVLLLAVLSFNRNSIEQVPQFWNFLAINLKQGAFPLVIAFCFVQHLLYLLFNN